MDKLDIIFDMQAKLNAHIIKTKGLEGRFSDTEWVQKHMLAMMAEMTEVLDEVNYKWWKPEKEVDYPALKEELVDVLHFFVSMCLSAGLTSEEILKIYMDKNKENFDRQDGKSEKKGYV